MKTMWARLWYFLRAIGFFASFSGLFLIPWASADSGQSDSDKAIFDVLDPAPGDRGEIVSGVTDPVSQIPDAVDLTDSYAASNPTVENLTASTTLLTPWGTPVPVSPNNRVKLNHYPRATTLAWQPVNTAISYVVERAYYSDSKWHPYPQVTVNGINNTSYTFNFIGDQPGRWRVKAYNGTSYSTPSAWWTFSYNTIPQMPTPVLTSPSKNEEFSHYPRTITLGWKMVPEAVGYKLERMYCLPDQVTCWAYPAVIINDPLNSSYTFAFVGCQPGKWRVTVLGAPTYRDSAPSAWCWFFFDI